MDVKTWKICFLGTFKTSKKGWHLIQIVLGGSLFYVLYNGCIKISKCD